MDLDKIDHRTQPHTVGEITDGPSGDPAQGSRPQRAGGVTANQDHSDRRRHHNRYGDE